MTQAQASVMLEMMRYMDVDWRNVKIGQLEAYYNEREHLIKEMSYMLEELLTIAASQPEGVEVEMYNRCRKLMKEV